MNIIYVVSTSVQADEQAMKWGVQANEKFPMLREKIQYYVKIPNTMWKIPNITCKFPILREKISILREKFPIPREKLPILHEKFPTLREKL